MSHSLSSNILAALETVLPDEDGVIGLHEPEFRGREWEYVKECLDTGWVSTAGAYVRQFEAALEAYTGLGHAVVVNTGTAALHMALMTAGVQANDEVLLPAMTFVATANSVAYLNAVPHFIDTSPADLSIDCDRLESYLKEETDDKNGQCMNPLTGRRIAALIVVHTYGLIGDMERLTSLCDRYGITLIEDAAEALGSFRDGKHAGQWGRISCLSFNGNKVATTGGGGAILTNDDALAEQVRHVASTAKAPHAWRFFHDVVGYNYRMPNINAAIGLAQLEQLESMIEQKRALADAYDKAFQDLAGASMLAEPAGCRSNRWLSVLTLDKPDPSALQTIIESAIAKRRHLRPSWDLMHTLPMFSQSPKSSLAQAEALANQIICLPSSARLGAASDQIDS